MTEKFVAEVEAAPHPTFDEFVATIEALRAPDGCPWDKEQTHRSIAGNMVEEAYEAVDAIEADDTPHMLEELGDVLLQVVLQSQIAADAGEFTIDDVCRVVNEKIVRRHPHVFGEMTAGDANEVLDVWDQIKMAEKEAADAAADAAPAGLLDGVPKSFPALKQAQKISRKAASAGFEWEMVDDVWAKVDEEITVDGTENPAALAAVELETGDVLFSLVNVARKMGGWLPAERITLAEALRAYTAGSAVAAQRAHELGTLEPGKLADIVVLEPNPFALAPENLQQTRVQATYVGGRKVYERP